MSQTNNDESSHPYKIFPRNLTARAAYQVPGNPVVSRTEDGVDNCYPGLEMDAKNIQKYFMPGLYFEVYRSDGTRLVSLEPANEAQRWRDVGLTDADIAEGLYLWAFKGRVKADQASDNPPITSFGYTFSMGGLYGWRMINALYPGKLAIVIAPGAPLDEEDPAAVDQWLAINDALETFWLNDESTVVRDGDGKLVLAVLVGERARYLNEQGVLDPDVYQPGELTRTLCTPWTYDFRDCQCFYWASNKPDVNASEDGKYPYLNFQRKNWQVEPQTEDIANNYVGRRKRELDYADMMVDWEQLRPVLNGRECGQNYEVPPGPVECELMDKTQIIAELSYLATVEHALAVQYLYAYYSIDAPLSQPKTDEQRAQEIWQQAQVIFAIAVDEMRHFHWANQALRLLGAPVTVDRGTELGRKLNVPFYLQSMNSEQLQWFIDVERPSKDTSAGLDGMYVGLLRSVQALPDGELDSVINRQVVEILKLIIDEGEEHYQRFSNVEQVLSIYSLPGRVDLPTYVRSGRWSVIVDGGIPGVPIDQVYGVPAIDLTPSVQTLQLQSDAYYRTLLTLLLIAFGLEDEEVSGAALMQAISMMHAMNAVNFQLAEQGSTPLFKLPPEFKAAPTFQSREACECLLQSAKDALINAGVDIELNIGMGKHQGVIAHVFDYFYRIVKTLD